MLLAVTATWATSGSDRSGAGRLGVQAGGEGEAEEQRKHGVTRRSRHEPAPVARVDVDGHHVS